MQALVVNATLAVWAIWGAPPSLPPNVKLTTVRLEVPVSEDSAGSLIAADVTGDSKMELLVTAPGYLGVYSSTGGLVWSTRVEIRVGGASEANGLPGHHGPGVQAGDLNGDGRAEAVFLTQDSTIHVLDGTTGRELWTARPPVPQGAERWEHIVIANLRGEGDRDLLLQATNRSGSRMGRYVAAYRTADLQVSKMEPLWQRDDFLACAHNGARVADLDGDGRDEVISGSILSPAGKELFRFPVSGHLDSVFVGDLRPDLPGLEVVTLEEGGRMPAFNRVFAYGAGKLLFETHHNHSEPQNAAIGRFDPTREGLQIWCRSRHDKHQKPFVFNAHGELIFAYEMDDVAPEGWTDSGVEVIHTIDWTGEEKQLAAAKERHTNGDICVFDPMTGRFLLCIDEIASRLYVADVLGDWREEIIVWNDRELHIYMNTAANPRPNRPRLWKQQHYRRLKTTWNYYSP